MENQNLPENVILAKLSPSDPKISEELKQLNETVSQKSHCSVVVDFSNVEIINSSNISNLLLLRGFLDDKGHRLFFYKVRTVTKCIFLIAGLTELFVFVDDIEDVLKAARSEVCTKR